MQPEDIESKRDLLRQVRDLIATIAITEEQIPIVLELLATTPDWAPHIAQARVNQEAFDAYWRDFRLFCESFLLAICLLMWELMFRLISRQAACRLGLRDSRQKRLERLPALLRKILV